MPRPDVPVILYDDGEGLVAPALAAFATLGFTRLFSLAGGLSGWRDAGQELFADVNSYAKAFGELVEHVRHTPSLPAETVQALIREGADIRIVDARRPEEYTVMSIPTATSVPGAELVLHARAIAPNPTTTIIVNCAGRTRSIIGAQSLVNAGVPNPVFALRNGTIGWTLAGQALERGQARGHGPVDPASVAAARSAARNWPASGRMIPAPIISTTWPARALCRRAPPRISPCAGRATGAGDGSFRAGPGRTDHPVGRSGATRHDDRFLARPTGLGHIRAGGRLAVGA
ncbi:rhodanese-like domain-containing protein [Sphingobium sufflavum]|uniref:rhodanese-like domain-containing protein n=1 Tax=Sphingobium sufflavum TaxID=1129547 RepID=UPI00389A507A